MMNAEETDTEYKKVRNHVTEKVINYFIDNIADGNWKVGEKIPSENSLKDTLGVSRSSVRAAIQQFIGLGAMESIKRKGTFLRDDDLTRNKLRLHSNSQIDVVDALTLLEYRVIIEPEACYRAAQKLTDKNLDNLRRFLEKMRDSIENIKEFVHYDMLFHEEIILSTGNILLIDSFNKVMHQKTSSLEGINETFGFKMGMYYHALILNALETRDADLAKQMMKSHLQKAIDDLHFEKLGDKYGITE